MSVSKQGIPTKASCACVIEGISLANLEEVSEGMRGTTVGLLDSLWSRGG
jgi:hypothetical protein